MAEYIKEVYNPGGCYISVKLDMEAVQALQLEITAESVQRSILAMPRTKLKEQVSYNPPSSSCMLVIHPFFWQIWFPQI